MRREPGLEYFDELNAELTAHAASFDKYSCYDDDEDYACHPPKMVDDLIEYRDKFYGSLYGILDKYQQLIEADLRSFLTLFRRNWDNDHPARIFKHGYHYLAAKSGVKFLNAVSDYYLFLNDKSELEALLAHIFFDIDGILKLDTINARYWTGLDDFIKYKVLDMYCRRLADCFHESWLADYFKIPFGYFNFNYLYLYSKFSYDLESETHAKSYTNYLKSGFSDCITAEELDLIERTQAAMDKREYSILRAARDIHAILNEAVIRRFRKGLDGFVEKLVETGDHSLADKVRLEIDLLSKRNI